MEIYPYSQTRGKLAFQKAAVKVLVSYIATCHSLIGHLDTTFKDHYPERASGVEDRRTIEHSVKRGENEIRDENGIM